MTVRGSIVNHGTDVRVEQIKMQAIFSLLSARYTSQTNSTKQKALAQPGFIFGWGTTPLSYFSFPSLPPLPSVLPHLPFSPLSFPPTIPSSLPRPPINSAGSLGVLWAPPADLGGARPTNSFWCISPSIYTVTVTHHRIFVGCCFNRGWILHFPGNCNGKVVLKYWWSFAGGPGPLCLPLAAPLAISSSSGRMVKKTTFCHKVLVLVVIRFSKIP